MQKLKMWSGSGVALMVCAMLATAQPARALDIVTAPIQLFTSPCDNYLRFTHANAFCYTQRLNWTYSNPVANSELPTLAFILALPFMILDEKTNTTALDAQALLAQGYSEEEILSYKADLELVERESMNRKVNSEETALRLLNDLKSNGQFSKITLEIMGI